MTLRRNKYNNRRVFYDGHWFDSLREKRRYQELEILVMAKEITQPILQMGFVFSVNGNAIFEYRADFVYTIRSIGKEVVEDAKGCRTDVYKLKKKLIEAQYGIKIIEV